MMNHKEFSPASKAQQREDQVCPRKRPRLVGATRTYGRGQGKRGVVTSAMTNSLPKCSGSLDGQDDAWPPGASLHLHLIGGKP